MFETHRSVVYPWQLDHMDHMNVQWYTAKFDEATWHLFPHLGITVAYMREHDRGLAAVAQNTEYKAEALVGDLLVVTSRPLEIRSRVLRFGHVMSNAESGEEIARTELTGVHMDKKVRKSCPFPEEIVHRCTKLIEGS